MKELIKVEVLRNKIKNAPSQYEWNAFLRGGESKVTKRHIEDAIKVLTFAHNNHIAFLTQQKEKCKK